MSNRISAFLAYLPIIGWLYVYFFQRKNSFAIFHLRQSIGLFIFLIGAFVLWAVIAYILALIPYVMVISMALFAIVIAAYLFGFVIWIMGMLNALRNQMHPLPGIGKRANRLPIS